MKRYVITLRKPSGRARFESMAEHLDLLGVTDYVPFYGVDGKAFGLTTTLTYDVDHPGTNFKISPSVIGCTLSHWMLWSLLDHDLRVRGESDPVMVLEDDARFHPDAMVSIERAIEELPENWDMLYPGSCCTEGRIISRLRAGLVECHPQCTHCYIVKPSSCRRLITTNTLAWAPIDIQMIYYSFPAMKVYAMVPRVVDQPETELPD